MCPQSCCLRIGQLCRGFAGVCCLLIFLPAAPVSTRAATVEPIRRPQDIARQVLTSAPLGGDPVAEAVDPQRGRLYVAVLGTPGGPGSLRTFATRTGRLLHAVPVGAGPAAIAVAERAGRVFLAGADRLTTLDAATGSALGTSAFTNTMSRAIWPLSGAIALAVDEVDDRLFLLAGASVDIYAATGRPLGTVPIGYPATSMAFDPGSGHLLVVGQQPPPPEHNLGSGDCDQAPFCPDKLSVIDGRTGHLLATTVLPGPQPGNPTPLGTCGIGVDSALHRALLARVAEGRGRPPAVIVDTRSGKVLGMPGIYFNGCPVQVDQSQGRAFVLTASNAYAPQTWDSLTLVDLHTGASAGDVTPGGQFTALTFDEQRQHVFLFGISTSGTMAIRVIDGRSGAVLRTIPLGTAPWTVQSGAPPGALAVDERTEHLFAAVPANGSHVRATLFMLNAAVAYPPPN